MKRHSLHNEDEYEVIHDDIWYGLKEAQEFEITNVEQSEEEEEELHEEEEQHELHEEEGSSELRLAASPDAVAVVKA